MTINDLCCDICGRMLARPSGLADPRDLPGQPGGVRFVYHPGKPDLRDDSGLACEPCWEEAVGQFGDPAAPGRGRCAACGTAVSRLGSLHLRRSDNPQTWRLCAPHAAGFLNRLRTVQPKLDPATFRFPFG
jgi:hypothetical protein